MRAKGLVPAVVARRRRALLPAGLAGATIQLANATDAVRCYALRRELPSKGSMAFQFNRDIFWQQFSGKFGPVSQSPTDGLNFILDQVAQDTTNWLNLNEIAYALATFAWETAHTFQPIHEKGPLAYFSQYDPGTPKGQRLGNTQAGDGFLFRGRGYVQLTGRTNYTKVGQFLSVDLVGNPDLALQPPVAYKIAANGMRLGWFTGQRLRGFMPTGGPADYVNARKIINGLDHAADIAAIAQNFQLVLTAAAQSSGSAAQTAGSSS